MTTMWDLIGHEAITKTLASAIAQGRLGHAYLLVGPPGVGKTALALALARALNCPEPDTPCGRCSTCRRINGGLYPDLLRVAVEENKRDISIEQIEEVQHFLSLRAFEGRYRVVLLREAERTSHPAANRLLKTLEEPPPQTLLVLTTAEEEHLLPTVRSRCQRIELAPVPLPDLVRALQQQHGLPPEEAARLAAYARGRPGLALAAKADPSLLEEREASLELLEHCLQSDLEVRLELSQQLAGMGASAAQRTGLQATLRHWEDWWRDFLVVAAGSEEGLLLSHRLGSYRDGARGWGPEQALRALQAIRTARTQLDQNANPRLVMDVLLLGFPVRVGNPAG